jgi:hypothetical protein
VDEATVLTNTSLIAIVVLVVAFMMYSFGAIGLITQLFRRSPTAPALRRRLGLRSREDRLQASAGAILWDVVFVGVGVFLAGAILINSIRNDVPLGVATGIGWFVAASLVAVAIVRNTAPE